MAGIDRAALAGLIAMEGSVVRVVVVATQGSTPREVGAAMCVTGTGLHGTIGGGALEHGAVQAARNMLAGGAPARLDRLALGPALNQCCGGAVTLLSERFTAADTLPDEVFARPLPGLGCEMPLAVSRILTAARGQGLTPLPQLVQGWFVEPVSPPARHLWLWGAGHVGRAVAAVMAPLPGVQLTWIDAAPDRFPPDPPPGVTILPAADPALLAGHAPRDADHLVMTFSHPLDLEICHRLLGHGFGSLGLIGSASKAARFRSRLRDLGHPVENVARIRCPIGDPGLGKHPQAIALGVAVAFLTQGRQSGRERMGA